MIDIANPLVVTMIVYFIVTILIAWWFGRGSGSGYTEFTLSGKTLSIPVYTMTYFATFTGGGLVMGVAQSAFLRGISAQWYAMTEGLAFITITIIIGFLYSFDVVSIPELLGRAFGEYARYLTAFITAIGLIALTAGQTIGMASIIVTVTEIPYLAAFWASTILFIGITVYGGMSSVAWADMLHGIVLIVGIVIAIPVALMQTGGIGAITNQVPSSHTNWFGVGLVQIGSWYLMYIASAGANQSLLQRTWSAKSQRVAVLGTFLAGAIITGFGILTALAGMIAQTQAGDINSASAFAWTIANTLPPSIAGLILAGAVGAVMSGADSFLLSGATTVVNDFYIPIRGRENVSETHLVRVTRLLILVFGFGGALVALTGINIVPLNTFGLGFMGVLFAGLVAMFWSGTQPSAGLPGLVVGSIAFFIWQFPLGEPELFNQGTLESAVVGMVATFITIIGLSIFRDAPTIDIDAIQTRSEDMSRIGGGDTAANDDAD